MLRFAADLVGSRGRIRFPAILAPSYGLVAMRAVVAVLLVCDRRSCRPVGRAAGKAAGTRLQGHPAERVLRAVRGQRASRRRQHSQRRENPRRPEETGAADARDPALLLDRRRRTGAADRRGIRPEGHGRRLDRQERRSQRARDPGRHQPRQAQQQRQRHRRRQRDHLSRRAEGRRPRSSSSSRSRNRSMSL